MVKEPSMFNVLYTIGPTKNGAQGIAAIKKAFKVDDKKAKDLLDKAIDFSSSGKIKTLTRSQQSMLNKQGAMKEEVISELSKKTLGSYAKKAVSDVSSRAIRFGNTSPLDKPKWNKSLKKLTSRQVNLSKAVDKMTKEEVNEVQEAKDLDTKNVDKALAHDCAKHVVHEKWGEGNCIPHMHTLEEKEDGTGFVTHYDVMFEHGIEQNIPVEDLEIVVSENHMHSKKKMKEEVEIDEAGPKIDPAKMAAHMARNDKPKKMSSTQKSLAAIQKKANEAMDPVGQADADIDNDGDVDSSDKYLHKRRKAISKALAKKKN